jgi:acyl-CoA reductase-like NAD-dependent aldehyde dehydrogenase
MPVDVLNTSGPVPSFINNAPFITRSTFTVLNPNDEERKPLHDAYGVDPDEAIRAVEAAHAALPGWSPHPVSSLTRLNDSTR